MAKIRNKENVCYDCQRETLAIVEDRGWGANTGQGNGVREWTALVITVRLWIWTDRWGLCCRDTMSREGSVWFCLLIFGKRFNIVAKNYKVWAKCVKSAK